MPKALTFHRAACLAFLLPAALLSATLHSEAAPQPVVIVVNPQTRPKPKTYDPYYYQVKTDKKKTTVYRDTAGNVTVKQKKKGQEKVTITNRYGEVIYKEKIKKK